MEQIYQIDSRLTTGQIYPKEVNHNDPNQLTVQQSDNLQPNNKDNQNQLIDLDPTGRFEQAGLSLVDDQPALILDQTKNNKVADLNLDKLVKRDTLSEGPDLKDQLTAKQQKEYLKGNQLKNKLKEAIRFVFDGDSLTEASKKCGKNRNWLAMHKSENSQRIYIALEEFVTENSLSDSEKEELIDKLTTRRDSLRGDSLTIKVREAIELVANGDSMKDASIKVGKANGWLGAYRGRNKDSFSAILDEFIDSRNLSKQTKDELFDRLFIRRKRDHLRGDQLIEKIKEAVGFVFEGDSWAEASLKVGKGRGWLSVCKHQNSQIVGIALKEFANENNLEQQARDELFSTMITEPKQQYLRGDQMVEKIKESLEFVLQGASLRQASSKVGRDKGWLSDCKFKNIDNVHTALEEFAKERNLSEQERQTLSDKLISRQIILQGDQLINQLKGAIGHVFDGDYLTTASLKIGKSEGWLSNFKCKNSESMRVALDEFAKENNLTSLEKESLADKLINKRCRPNREELIDRVNKAIGFVFEGDSLAEASQKVGRSKHWLSTYRSKYKQVVESSLEEFAKRNCLSDSEKNHLLSQFMKRDSLKNYKNKKNVDLIRKVFGLVFGGNSLKEASKKVGVEPNWLLEDPNDLDIHTAFEDFAQENKLTLEEQNKLYEQCFFA